MVAAEFSILREYSTESDMLASVADSDGTVCPTCSILRYAIGCSVGALRFELEHRKITNCGRRRTRSLSDSVPAVTGDPRMAADISVHIIADVRTLSILSYSLWTPKTFATHLDPHPSKVQNGIQAQACNALPSSDICHN